MASSKEREKAMQALAEAEDRFKSDDLDGAIRLAQRARDLCPSLHHASNLVVALRILRTAGPHPSEKQQQSTAFWHAILGSRPTDTVEALKRQYRRLCIQVHPDKNPSAAAEGAFKLVAQAYEFLSAKKTGAAAKNSNARESEKQKSKGKGSANTRSPEKEEAAGAGGSSSKAPASASAPQAPSRPCYGRGPNESDSNPKNQGTWYNCGSSKIFVSSSSSSRTDVRSYVDANGVEWILIS